ncbi:MAG: aldo/keto reductase [Promicromonosporaceae bacterium]|nr:aldo/keto reductase [Promicromonosporaceae bacterium]
MRFNKVGSSGLRVSALALGTMTWGRGTDLAAAAEQLNTFLDAGGNLVDVSASYGGGDAELVLRELLTTGLARDELVISLTGSSGASRRALISDVDHSLARLGLDHVDLYLVGSPDASTPLEETATALRLLVESGRARYVGIANHPGWAAARLASLLERVGDGLTLTAHACEYSLLQRGVEREVLPAADALGTGLLAWSPQGRGVLTGKYRHSIPVDSRAASTGFARFVEPYLTGEAARITEAVATASAGLGRNPSEVALAWLWGRPGVTSALVGARTPAQLRQALAAVDLDLPPQVRDALDEVSAIEIGYPERW